MVTTSAHVIAAATVGGTEHHGQMVDLKAVPKLTRKMIYTRIFFCKADLIAPTNFDYLYDPCALSA